MYKRPLTDLKYIIVHHTATQESLSANDIRNIHRGMGYSDVGYHYLVDRKGNKFTGRNINNNGAHTIGEKKPELSLNRTGIGIALIGSYENNPPNATMVNEVVYLIKVLSKKYSIPLTRDRIFGHKDVDYTACPGKDTMKLIYDKLKI